MYQDWGLSVPQKWAKLLPWSQVKALSRIFVLINTSAWLKVLITHVASAMHVWHNTGLYPHINIRTEYKHHFVWQISIQLMVSIDTDVYKKTRECYEGFKSFQDWGQSVAEKSDRITTGFCMIDVYRIMVRLPKNGHVSDARAFLSVAVS